MLRMIFVYVFVFIRPSKLRISYFIPNDSYKSQIYLLNKGLANQFVLLSKLCDCQFHSNSLE